MNGYTIKKNTNIRHGIKVRRVRKDPLSPSLAAIPTTYKEPVSCILQEGGGVSLKGLDGRDWDAGLVGTWDLGYKIRNPCEEPVSVCE